MKSFVLALVLGVLSTNLWAIGFEGEISFSRQETLAHQASVDTIVSSATECLKHDLNRHQAFFKRYGISAYYGDRSQFAKMSRTAQERTLKKLGLPTSLLDQMAPTSCVGLTLKCLESGFLKAGQASIWSKIKTYTKRNSQDGTALQNALQKLGWTLHYWNPDPNQNEIWDRSEHNKDPDNSGRFWGYHAYRFLTISRENRYYFNVVDDSNWLVGFQKNPPANFSDIPFFVGTAHTGYHVFPGMYGQVIEGHSTRSITDPNTLESSPFNPLQDGGGPRGLYRSGLILIPPGYY